MTGKVKFFKEKEGFGFIKADDGSKDLFVHHSDISMDGYRTLSDGQPVEFESVQTDKGRKAIKVVPL